MNVYIIEATGKHAYYHEDVSQRHPNAFTRREDAEAAKDAFLESVFQVFDQRYGVHVQVIELEVVGPQSAWIIFEGASFEGENMIGAKRTREEAVQFVQEDIEEDGRQWNQTDDTTWRRITQYGRSADYLKIEEVRL